MSAQTNNSEDELATGDALTAEPETIQEGISLRTTPKTIILAGGLFAMLASLFFFLAFNTTDAAQKQHDKAVVQQQQEDLNRQLDQSAKEAFAAADREIARKNAAPTAPAGSSVIPSGTSAVNDLPPAPVYVPPAAPAAQYAAPASSTKDAPATSFDPTLPLTLLGFPVAAFVLIKFAGMPIVSSIRSRKRRKAAHAQTWTELFKHKSDLMTQWSRYETDIALMIDYPIMTDYTDPVIQKVIAAMQKMRRAETLHIDMSQASAEGSALQSAVDEFEIAFVAAEKYAKRYGQSNLQPAEIKKLSAARQALNIILDGESPAYEVNAAYKSLRGSLKGIIDLPQQAIASLEQITRKSLEAAPELVGTI